MKHSTSKTLIALLLFSAGALGAETINGGTYTYREINGRTLKAYVFKPLQANGSTRAAVLLFHGGAWQLGDATWMFERAKEFAGKGLVAISIEYRLAVGGLSPVEGVEDACAAFVWARAHAHQLGIDSKRIAGYGVSAGGHLVAAAATLPSVSGRKLTASSRPSAMLLYSPALNMAEDAFFVRLMNGHGNPHSYSPSTYVSRKLPPTLIIQGEKDSIVLAKDAEEFCAKATKAPARCELHMYPGVGHLLTRNLTVQYKDFDSDPAFAANAHQVEDSFLESLRYTE